jgi:hypothetical protein
MGITMKNIWRFIALCFVGFIIVAHSGEVVSWGSEDDIPPELDGGDVVSISTFGQHSLARLSGGSVIAWGNNYYGQCDVPTQVTNTLAVAAGSFHSMALLSDNSLIAWGNNAYGQCLTPAGVHAVSIACGDTHSMALLEDGSILAWGDNHYGQCSPPEGVHARSVACGITHSLALLSDGSVIAWGDNTYGQCKAPALTNAISISAGGDYSLALLSDGRVVAWGNNEYGQCDVSELSNVTSISAGFDYGLAVFLDGQIVSWGLDSPARNVPPTFSNAIRCCAGMTHGLALTIFCRDIPPDDYATVSIEHHGALTWSNSDSNSIFQVEWASELGKEWRTDNPFERIHSSSNSVKTALPMFFRVVRKNSTGICFENMNKQDLAIHYWALEKAISYGSTVTENDIILYIPPDYINTVFQCPSGGAYTLGPVGTNCSCSIHGTQ